MFDILITGGRVADGTGKAAYFADVAIKGDKIVKIAPTIEEPARQTIDATGLVVAPGFIDSHNHSESFVFTGTDAYNYLEQGVTTQVCGNCGDSVTPYHEGLLRWIKDPEERADCAKLSATPTSFMAAAEQASLGVNMAMFVGHSAIRGNVMGFDPSVPNREQLAAMERWIVEAMECGYLGYSTGLIYAPSAFAKTAELVALAKVMKPYGGIYSSHIRNEGDGVVESVKEAIRIGSEAGVQVQISHLKVMGKHNEGLSEKLLKLIEQANADGTVVYADQYPYEASASSLRSRVPSKYHEGGRQALLQRLKDPAVRKNIAESVFRAKGSISGVSPIAPEDILFSQLDHHPEYVGMTLAQLAQSRGCSPVDAFCDLLICEDTSGNGIYFNQSQSDIRAILQSPWVFGGSDSSNLPDERYDPDTRFGVHPRTTGALVRRLELQRQLGVRMEDAIHRITGGPAKAFGLAGQGVLEEGAYANITVLDYENLRSLSTYEYPHRGNEGICYVLVNGTVAVEKGRCLSTRAGRLLKKAP